MIFYHEAVRSGPDTQPADLIKRIREIIISTRSLTARSINTAQVAMNFAIGQRIVEHEQAGEAGPPMAGRCWPIYNRLWSPETGRQCLPNLTLI
ncbi:hypothetical protein LJB86_03285 [Deltaproteobacteria bacterium OttesenSCG-928-M10]|nr:hypothetical protein [Deltaproteobacteria bacterium OttesenSCG-928-M10]